MIRLALSALFAAGLLAQEPPPPTPPVPVSAHGTEVVVPKPNPVTPEQEPAPEAESGAGRGRRQGGRGQDKKFELPEFTPVSAPPLGSLAGKQYFWFCIYPHFVVQYDPVTDAITQRVQLANGMFWSTELTHDRKRLLVVTDQQRTIEVVDLANASLAGTHSFSEDGYILRIREVRELPGGEHWLVRTDRVKKEIDRYSFEPSRWLLYDSKNKKTVEKFDRLPEAMDRRIELAADGSHWLSQDRDGNLLFLEARKLTEIGRIDLATPRFFGAGGIRLSGTDLLDGRDPKRALMLFTSSDPVEKSRSNWGIAELDLENRKLGSVTEWGPSVSSWGLRVCHKKRIGAMMTGSFGRGSDDAPTTLKLYDLNTGTKLAEAYERFRPRRSLVAISPEGDKVYVGTAGSDFEVFDSKLQRLKTVELEGEIWGRIYVVDG